MFGSYSPAGGPSKDLPHETTLYEHLDSILARRDIVLVGDWNEAKTDFEPEPIYLVRGDVIAAFNSCHRPWEELVDQYFDAVDVVPGTVLAATAVVLV